MCDGSEEKEVISSLSELESVIVQDTINFYLSRRSKKEHPVGCHAGDGKHRVACRCDTRAMNPIAGCHNQGLQNSVWQLL